jgi:transcriptional regulator
MKMNIQQKRINIALLEASVSQTDIARELETNRQYVCNVISGRRQSERIEDHIARRTGFPVERLFFYRQRTDPKNRTKPNGNGGSR